jgi:hypothetical protein
MALSPAHQFGQIVGNVIEEAVFPLLSDFAGKHKLYLDRQGERPARSGKKVAWEDQFGNVHDLDYVLEREGTPERIGIPIAFIEIAWRRYTKHSRNKAQEIQGAILPLMQTHRNLAPLSGVILAGVFTDGALEQLRSQGFVILYFPYPSVIKAFAAAGIDAEFDQDTPDKEFKKKVAAWAKLKRGQKESIASKLIERNSEAIESFMQSLERTVTRRIASICVLPLHGKVMELARVEQAIEFIDRYQEMSDALPVSKYEIQIKYSNGDKVEALFIDKTNAIDFLRGYLPAKIKPVK